MSKFPIRNIYAPGASLPWDEVKVVGAGVLLQPVRPNDFKDGTLAVSADANKNRTDILRVFAVGPDVTAVVVGDYCIPISASVDLIDPRGKYVMCEQADIRVVFSEASLAPIDEVNDGQK